MKSLIFLPVLALSLFSCVEPDDLVDSPRGNFEALWKIMDEHYCFFDYKQVDWNAVHYEYSLRIADEMDDEALFMLLNEMLQTLKDGHVNLYTPFDVGRYWKWYEDSLMNYNEAIVRNYLGTDYHIAGGIRYKILDDNIAYLRYADFTLGIGETNLDYIIQRAGVCAGMIIDVRENGGGYLSYSDLFASRFLNEKTLVGYVQYKIGKGHDDFSKPLEKYLEPSTRLRFQKPVVVITNCHCYSATNDFVNSMRYCPNVTLLGNTTGGGGGLPFSSELPNGWSVRFSACPTLDANMQHIEFGIAPDFHVDMTDEDVMNGKDTMIEAAREYLKMMRE